jgi:hypothetical protein
VWLFVYASGFLGFCHGGAGMLSGVVRECSFFIIGLDYGDNCVWVCCDFVCYGVPDCLQVGLISGSGL